MRKGLLILFIGLALVGFIMQPGAAQAATWTNTANPDIVTDTFARGNDYTRTWKAMGYNTPTGMDLSLIQPCPNYLLGGPYATGDCPVVTAIRAVAGTYLGPGEYPWVETMGAQTQYGLNTNNGIDTIVDDIAQTVLDHWKKATPQYPNGKGILDQDIDLFFSVAREAGLAFMPPAGMFGTFTIGTTFGNTIDQQLSYWDDVNTNNIVNPNTENGITQRLVNEFDMELVSFSMTGKNTGHNANYLMDQWVVQWLRDVEPTTSTQLGKEGIDQYFSDWVLLDNANTSLCAMGVCSHTYDLTHPLVTKSVKQNTHDHTPSDITWDP